MRHAIIALSAFLVMASHAGPVPDFPFIAVSGTVTRDVAPDQATVRFRVHVHAVESKVAVKGVQDTLRTLVAELVKLGVPEKAITDHELDKSAVRERTESYRELNYRLKNEER